MSAYSMADAIIKHPGTILSDEQYKAIKNNKSGIDRMMKDCVKWPGCQCICDVDIGPYGAGKGHEEFTSDCMQSYKFVLLWLATGDDTHAKKACNVISAWSTTCKSFKGANAPLECAWGGAVLVRSAEILKHKWPGWRASGCETQINNFIDRILLPNLTGRYNEIIKWNNNWILTIQEALMQIYIFRNDIAKFKWVIEEYKKAAPKTFLGTTGKNTECERDFVHATFQLHSHIQICEIARHQGINLYSDLIRASCEYIAAVINGEVPADIKKENIKQPWFVPGAWDIAYNYFVNADNKPMPKTAAMLSAQNRRPENSSFNWGPGWSHHLSKSP